MDASTSESVVPAVVTVIIPTFRRPQRLRRAIASVLSQTYRHVRVCVYDNDSGDETAEVVDSIARRDQRVFYHCHSENVGPINNHLFGMERVETEYFVILCDDDFLLPHFFATAVSYLESHKDVGFYAGRTLVVEEEGEKRKAMLLNPAGIAPGIHRPPEGFYDILKNHIAWHAIVFRSTLLREVGLFDPDTNSLIEWDFEFRIARRFPFYYEDEIVFVFVDHAEEYFSKQRKVYSKCKDMIALVAAHISSADMDENMRAALLAWAWKALYKPLRLAMSGFPSKSECARTVLADARTMLSRKKVTGIWRVKILAMLFLMTHPLAAPVRRLQAIAKERAGEAQSSAASRYGETVNDDRFDTLVETAVNKLKLAVEEAGG